MSETKHGGSPLLGLAPAGLENLPKLPGSELLLEAPTVGAGRRTKSEADERARHFERRRLALALAEVAAATAHDAARADGSIVEWKYDAGAAVVKESVRLADLLIAETGGVV